MSGRGDRLPPHATALCFVVTILAMLSTSIFMETAGAAADSAAGRLDDPLTPIPIESLAFNDESENLRELHLVGGGQRLISGRVHRDERWHEFLVHLEAPDRVVIQVISRTDGFEPLLLADWINPHGQSFHDSDKCAGRGGRPMLVARVPNPPAKSVIRVRVQFERYRLNGDEFTEAVGHYIVHIRQPSGPGRDLDPDTVGIESSPILLDSSGYGRAHPGKYSEALPAIERPADMDTFQIRSISTNSLQISVDGTVGELNPHVRLYNEDRNLIAEGPSGDSGRRVTLSVRKPLRGDLYFLVVSSYDNPNTGVYMIQIRQQPSDARALQ